MIATAAELAIESHVRAATVGTAPEDGIDSVASNRIILTGISWATYEALLSDHRDRSVPRFAYDRGVLEIMSPRKPHEEDNRGLADIVTIVSASIGVDILNIGSTTFRRSLIEKGFEADSTFYVQRAAEIGSKSDIDADVDPPPDLVIEADVTNSSLPKLPLFAAFGVPEVWRVESGRVVIYHLAGGEGYVERPASLALPLVTRERLEQFLLDRARLGSAAWFKHVLAWAEKQVEQI